MLKKQDKTRRPRTKTHVYNTTPRNKPTTHTHIQPNMTPSLAMEEAKGVDGGGGGSGGTAAADNPNPTTKASPPSGAGPACPPPPFEPTYTGATFFTTRLDTESAPTPSTPPSDLLAGRLAFRDILQPVSDLTAILLTAVKTDPHWLLKAGLASIPPSTRLSIITDKVALNGKDDEDDEGESHHAQRHGLPVVSRAERALQILTAGRPKHAPPPTLHEHPVGGPMMHAKLSILRFGKREGFVRIVVSSANLYAQWGQARDVLWLQDFPIDKEALRRQQTNAPLSINIDNDGLGCGFRDQLAYFCVCMGIEMGTRLFDLLKGVDCRKAKASLIMSVPCRDLVSRELEKLNGHMGLRHALGKNRWPAAARDAPITCVQGSLGKVLMERKEWIRGVWRSLTADGKHAARPLDLGTLCVWWYNPSFVVLHWSSSNGNLTLPASLPPSLLTQTPVPPPPPPSPLLSASSGPPTRLWLPRASCVGTAFTSIPSGCGRGCRGITCTIAWPRPPQYQEQQQQEQQQQQKEGQEEEEQEEQQ